ncbi:cob(I)yrinic acid a,c-diamide adenosyltransferase [Halomonas sp. McH1-25]|uniref:cob(I)yrinic acid a,c-diamide adenosyltransferase n=1 Tax=unclassified Halomonas TaxID=2609666 RepID=UPI001EF58643|nr:MULTISPECIES: cob(I)yrinic acid a,c-diamide adenosyltransferase [unclassified Halomonas]MCG7599892.1 cob(I)yrinic acid a,c-diamide adenosyltransferase [Halomonas sp. McH1-25]MCP1344764.1 cob(I)yrinic acid a,c-diamide adenosyltransferase [Halomonas sp. FL8]MCP1362886.1 cob(I)yrinic acid a,c-diamide adenosyltransferase [Halomonas sp. BBD45]MCP1366993.1 cob(I)yrinic acid a,c-diamide adenosyltransferase [Halomonas sp. BBD48]
MSDDTQQDAYRQQMARKKRLIEARVQKADRDQGVLLVNTGNGKGKSSAGFGVIARALGHDMQVGVVQFIKGAFSTGEETFFRRLPGVEYHVMGEGFTWETQDRDRDIAAAGSAWEVAARMLSDERYQVVLLDELNIVLNKELLPLDEVLDALRRRPIMQHVVVTGRHAPQALIELADTVTWMKMERHAFKAGIRAQRGMEL